MPALRSSIIDDGLLALPMKPDKALQMIAVEDIGAFAALAFENPVDYSGKAMELAGDQITIAAGGGHPEPRFGASGALRAGSHGGGPQAE